jgi:O-antigen ligase
MELRRLGREFTLSGWLVLACGLLLGAVIGGANLLPGIAVFGALFAAALAIAEPLVGLFLLLGATTFVPTTMVMPLLNSRSIGIPDLILVFVFAILLARALLGKVTLIWPDLLTPLLAFLAMAFAGLLVGRFLHGANLFEEIREFRVVLYYALLFPIVNLVRTRRDLERLAIGCFLIGGLAVLTMLRGSHGRSSALSGTDAVYYAFEELAGGSGNTLVYWSACCCAALLLLHGRRWILAAFLPAYALYFALMFQRHMYGMLGFAGASVAALSLRVRPARAIKMLIIALVVAVAAISAALAVSPTAQRYATLTLERLTSIHGITGANTVKYRQVENRYAMSIVRAHPIAGIGFAVDYRPSIYGPEDNLQRFIHNGYLFILIKTGGLGMAAFLWLSLAFVIRGLRSLRGIEDPFCRAVVIGSITAYTGIAFANSVAPYFIQDWGVATLGLMMGIGEAAWRVGKLAKAEGRQA